MDQEQERNIRNDENIKILKEDVSEIKGMLRTHIIDEQNTFERIAALHRQDVSAIYVKISTLDKKYSLKWVEKLVYFLIAGASLSFIGYLALIAKSIPQ